MSDRLKQAEELLRELWAMSGKYNDVKRSPHPLETIRNKVSAFLAAQQQNAPSAQQVDERIAAWDKVWNRIKHHSPKFDWPHEKGIDAVLAWIDEHAEQQEATPAQPTGPSCEKGDHIYGAQNTCLFCKQQNPKRPTQAQPLAQGVRNTIDAMNRAVSSEEDDDPFIETVARAIAENAFSRPWDDFAEVNASEIDQCDLLSFAGAAIEAILPMLLSAKETAK